MKLMVNSQPLPKKKKKEKKANQKRLLKMSNGLITNALNAKER